MLNYASYGYEVVRHTTKRRWDGPTPKPVKRVPPSMQKELALLAATPIPVQEEELVALYWATYYWRLSTPLPLFALLGLFTYS